MVSGSALHRAPAVPASRSVRARIAASRATTARFNGRLLAKVGLDCVTGGLDIEHGWERDAYDPSARQLRQRCQLLREVRRHALEQRPIRGDRDCGRATEVDA